MPDAPRIFETGIARFCEMAGTSNVRRLRAGREREEEETGLPCPVVLARSGRGELRLEEVHGGDEVAVPDQHHEIDGIEVGFAGEAAGEVGPRVDGGEELAALRTEEAESPVALFVRPVELGEQRGDGDLIAETVQ